MPIPITTIRNAKAANAEATKFTLDIDHPVYGWIPYHLDPSDTDMTIDNDALRLLIGADFEAYVVPPVQAEHVEAEFDRRREAVASDRGLVVLLAGAIAIMNKSASSRTGAERTMLNKIVEVCETINTLESKRNRLAALPTIPQNYQDESHWSGNG